MSLAAAALRIAAVKALTGATSAEGRVYDSEVNPIELIGDKARPTIIVYTDAGRIDLADKSLTEAAQSVALTFEEFIGRAVKVQTETDGGGLVELEIPAKDAAYENYLQTLAYERRAALLRADGVSPWPDLFRRLFVRGAPGHPSEWDRGANAEKARFAFRREVLWLETVDDPVRGAPPPQLWSDLLAAMDADTDAGIKALAAYWRALITAPAVPSWRQVQQALGLTDAAMAALGDAPASEVLAPTTDDAPLSTEIDVTLEDGPATLTGTVTPDQITLAEDGNAPAVIVETP